MNTEVEFIGAVELAKRVNQTRRMISWKARRHQIPGMVAGNRPEKHRGRGYRFDAADRRLKIWMLKNRVSDSEPKGRAGRKPKSANRSATEILSSLPEELRGTNVNSFILALSLATAAISRKVGRYKFQFTDEQRRRLIKAATPLVNLIQMGRCEPSVKTP